MTLRRFIAGALGALIGLELCKLANGNLALLTVFTLFGGLAGFILVAPVVFGRQFKAFWQRQMEKMKAESEAALERARKERDEHPFRLRVQEMLEKNSHLFGVNFIILFGWFLFVTLCYVGFGYYPWMLVIWAGSSVFILMSSTPTYSYTQDDEDIAKEDLRCYTEQNLELKKLRGVLLILPASICIWIYKAVRRILRAIWWCLCNLGFLGKSFVLVLAITCSAVASLNRYLAAVGAIVGCIAGYCQGKNEWVAMVFGGLAGNGIYFVFRLALRILPDPKSAWPKPVPVKF